MLIPSKKRFRKVVIPPPDKAITQRAIILSLSLGALKIENPSLCGDSISALDCISALGAKSKITNNEISIVCPPISQIRASSQQYKLYAGNSATTARLMLGIGSGLGLKITVNGDSSLRRRTMRSTIKALSSMGAKLTPTRQKCPISITPSQLNGIKFKPNSPSAQVKSAILLAALNAKGTTTITEPIKTRDHTERMLSYLGYNIDYSGESTRVTPSSAAAPNNGDSHIIKVPGDMSSAAYMIAASLLTKNGYAFIKNVGLNPMRTGMLDLLISLGANIKIEQLGEACNEPVGNVIVNSSSLNSFELDALANPSLIDEIPILAVIAAFSRGRSVFTNLSVLKNKESNRMRETFKYLKKFGARAELVGDTLYIDGNGLKNNEPYICVLPPLSELNPKPAKPALKKPKKKKTDKIAIKSKDHRIIMSFAIAGTLTDGCLVTYPHLVNISYPDFFNSLLD